MLQTIIFTDVFTDDQFIWLQVFLRLFEILELIDVCEVMDTEVSK